MTARMRPSFSRLVAERTWPQSFLARSVAAVELQLAAEGNPYLEQLLDTFDRMWRDRVQAA